MAQRLPSLTEPSAEFARQFPVGPELILSRMRIALARSHSVPVYLTLCMIPLDPIAGEW